MGYMPIVRPDAPYDPQDEEDLINFARSLEGTTLGQWCPNTHNINTKGKGAFGNILESEVFHINNNSDSIPDFETLGIELKSTPLKKLKNGKKVSKERMVLSIINYMKLLEDGWEASFLRKNGRLLIVFYLPEERESIYEYKILKVVLWEYPEEDLWIIRQDWEKIVSMVRQGRAHELSERNTLYLAASRKGAGHGGDGRKQPNSDEEAPQRAFSLKQSYVNQIWGSVDDTTEIIELSKIDSNKTFEDEIVSRFEKYQGMDTDHIRKIVGPDLNSHSKSYYATLARRMLGVRTKKISEFEKAGITMKAIRLQKNGVPKEDMSFRQFRYPDLIREDMWEDSEFYKELDHRFLLILYQIDGDVVIFKEARFWSIPYEDMQQAKSVWQRTKELVSQRKYDDMPKKKDNPVSHVRPHARNSEDTTPGLEGEPRKKLCFWLDRKYLAEQLSNKHS